MHYFIIIGLIVILLFLVIRHIKRLNIKSDSDYIRHKEKAQEFNTKLHNYKCSYFDLYKKEILLNEYRDTYSYFSQSLRRFLKDSTLDEFAAGYYSLGYKLPEWNKKYLDQELVATKDFFDDIDGKTLDDQQRRAVITDEINNLVLAGAGSGKTLTIAAKVKYLINRKGIEPESILLLAFTRKAAGEMTERITRIQPAKIEASTFHKLGLGIITRYTGKRPDVNDNLLNEVIMEYFDNTISRSKEQMKSFIVFYGQYFTIPKDLEEYECLGDYYTFCKNKDLVTLKGKLEQVEEASKNNEKPASLKTLAGETVKSLEEVMIANFLFLHGVTYEYERPYPFEADDPYRKAYRPDFYLTDYDIYLEHFGITEDEKTPWLSEVESEKYIQGMHWKRQFHKKNNTKLIETYSYYNKDGSLLSKLERLLLENGVRFQEIDYEQYYRRVFKDNKEQQFKEFIKLINTAISLYKSNGYQDSHIKDIREKCKRFKTGFERDRAILFLDILKPIYQMYLLEQQRTNSIDFNDMINQATGLINNSSEPIPLEYIIVDEYQDVSQSRFNLIKAIRDKSQAKIMCVGDDWQSIFRFAGSDISLFTNFEKYLGFSKTLKIEKTYRNSSELIEVAESFITANPKQLKKHLLSDKHRTSPVILMGYHRKKEEALNRAVDEIVKEFGEKAEIALLGRTKYDLEYTLDNARDDWYYKENNGTTKVYCRKHLSLNIWFTTVHKSKGLEAENVIIINMEDRLLGFPNQIADDPLLSLFLSEDDEIIYAEERRLFYVALTRTKNSTYLLVPDMNPSVFVSEIIQSFNVTTSFNPDEKSIQSNPTCPRCKKGYLVIRDNNADNRKFLGCTNFPMCRNTINDVSVLYRQQKCRKCGGYMVERSGSHGDFYGCSNYPFCKNTW